MRDSSRGGAGASTHFLASVPADSAVVFSAGGCYAQASPIELSDRSRLVIDGRGARFVKTSDSVRGEGFSNAKPNLRITGGDHLTVQNVMISGTFSDAPNSPNQFDAGVAILGARGVLLKNLSVASVDGDLVTIGPDTRSAVPLAAAPPAQDVTIEALRGVHAARQGVAFTSTIGARVSQSQIVDVQNAIDLEPDVPGEPVRSIRIDDNQFGRINYAAIVAIPGASPAVGDVSLSRNRMTALPKACYPAIAIGGDSAAPSPLAKVGYVAYANSLLSRGDGILFNGVSAGSITANTIRTTVGRGHCSRVPIRSVGSNVTVQGNVTSGF
ncbi:MAG: hypothetical protein ACR2ND_11540 [Solirubrobacteraceae bacterium]